MGDAPALRRIAREVVLVEAALEASGAGIAGHCDIAAILLCERLARAGIHSLICTGTYAQEAHAWVQVGSWWADPTVAQFDADAPRLTPVASSPYAHMTTRRPGPREVALDTYGQGVATRAAVLLDHAAA